MKRHGRPLSWRRLAFYVWAAAVGLNLIVLAAFTLPRTLRERNLERRAAQLTRDVQAAQERNQALKTRSEIAVQNEADVRRFYRGLMGTRDQTLLPVLAEIDTLARETGLAPRDQKYQATPVKGRPIMRFRITVPMSGNYGQVVALLERLERSSHFLTVDEIKLRERPQEGAGATDLSLTFSTWFKDPQAAAAAAAAAAAKSRGTRRAS